MNIINGKILERLLAAKQTRAKKAERWREILRLRSDGLNLSQIADRLGISRGFASVIYSQAKADLEQQQDWLYGLSERAANVIRSHGFTSKEQVAEYAKVNNLLKFRNLGRLTEAEILLWVGILEPFDSTSDVKKIEADLKAAKAQLVGVSRRIAALRISLDYAKKRECNHAPV